MAIKGVTQEIASIIRKILETHDIPMVYNIVEKDFPVPSFYIPMPEIIPVSDTVSSFAKEMVLTIKLFDISNREAIYNSHKVMKAIMEDNRLIKLKDINGDNTGKNLKITSIVTGKIDERVSSITFRWKTYHTFNTIDAIKVQNYFITPKIT